MHILKLFFMFTLFVVKNCASSTDMTISPLKKLDGKSFPLRLVNQTWLEELHTRKFMASWLLPKEQDCFQFWVTEKGLLQVTPTKMDFDIKKTVVSLRSNSKNKTTILEEKSSMTLEMNETEDDFYVGLEGVSLTARKRMLGRKNCIYNSLKKGITFTTPCFESEGIFLEVHSVDAIVEIKSPPNACFPVRSIQIFPDNTKTLFIKGTVDFQTPTFKEFIVSNADIKLFF